MNMIVAADKNWSIGNDGNLLVQIPADMKQFRATTEGRVVVMGRKTLESLPGGIPLKKRTNIVLTRDLNYKIKDTIVCHSLDETLKLLESYQEEDIYIIGGESIYRQFLPYCKAIYVTKIDYSYQADTVFPNLDDDCEWILEEESEEQTYFNICYEFRKYVKK